MSMRIYLLTGLICAVCAGVSAFIDPKICFGILFSGTFSLINMFLLSFSMKAVINRGQADPSVMVLSNILRISLLLAVLYIAFRNPQRFSIVGVTIGLMLFMVALIIDAAGRKEG